LERRGGRDFLREALPLFDSSFLSPLHNREGFERGAKPPPSPIPPSLKNNKGKGVRGIGYQITINFIS
jgi:hypothetical protein